MSRGEMLKAISRRATFLKTRIDTKSSREKPLTFDIAEWRALVWALRELGEQEGERIPSRLQVVEAVAGESRQPRIPRPAAPNKRTTE